MPQYLKRDAVRMLSSSSECLSVALISLGLPSGRAGYLLGTSHTAGTGLLGVSVELALSACLVQAYGLHALEKAAGQFKSAAEVLEDFRTLVREAKANAAFLFAGVEDQAAHSKRLVDSSMDLKRLALVRAAALHGGVGLPRDACLIEAHRVAEFLELLAQSDRIRPYLQDVRRPPDAPVDRNVLLEELVKTLKPGVQSPAAAASLVALLPGLPSEQPEWFELLAQCVTAPRKLDVSLLLASMDAVPTTLRRAGGKATAMSVRVDPGNPNAIAIRPEDIKSSLTHLRERWGATRGVANGRLNATGRISLPSQEDIREAFSIGLEESLILEAGASFGPHDAWPFVASSLEVQGTPGPYWFILRRTRDLDHVRAILQTVARRNSWRSNRLSEVVAGIEDLEAQRPHPIPPTIRGWEALADANRAKLASKLKAHANDAKSLPAELEASVIAASRGEQSVGEVLAAVRTTTATVASKRYWARMLCESATEIEDVAALCAVLHDSPLDAAHTAARKALRWIDYATHGPPVLETDA